MQTHEITRRFIDHFTGTGHTRVPSASLILDDTNPCWPRQAPWPARRRTSAGSRWWRSPPRPGSAATTCGPWRRTCVRGGLGTRAGVVALFSADGDDKVAFVAATTAAACDRGLAAGKLIPACAPAVGARGGGKPDLAQGGGTNPAGIEDAVGLLRAALRT